MSITNKLIDSEGMKFLDRMHERSFSINIFRLNARDLINHLSTAEDLEKVIATFNSPVSLEEMTECARLVHNFLASAMTLIEHTRIFFKTHYANTEVNRIYSESVREKFERNELTRFVQDMRNFMLHKGLLPFERQSTAVGSIWPNPNSAFSPRNVWIAASPTSKSSPAKSPHGRTTATSATPKPTGNSQPQTPASS